MKLVKKYGLIFASIFIMSSFVGCKNEENKDITTSAEVTSKMEESSDKNEQKNIDQPSEDKNVASDTKVEETRTIVDHAGNTVELPSKIERIVIDQIPILSTYMAYNEGKAPYIVGYAGSLKNVISGTVLANMAPELMDTTNTVQAQSDINIEEIIKLNPDVIFYNAMNTKHYEILSKSGIPCVGFATIGGDSPADPINRYQEWLKLLEQVFGQEGKMDSFIADGNEIVEEIEGKISEIPEDSRPSSMILWKYADGIPTVAGKGTFGDFWLKRLGTNNVASEAKGYAQVNFEQINQWDSDILFLDGPGLLNITTEDVYNNSVEGADFSGLSAVANKRVYNTKLGMWNWLTPNPDGPLVLGWMAQETYPEEFKDYPLKEKIKDYYKKWYNYDLTDQELEDMFSI